MKTLNLYIDFEFTSLSPDAQPISVGIVSDEIAFRFPNPEPKKVTMNDRIPISKHFYSEFSDFDIYRCDDWVKENVVRKLKYNNCEPDHRDLFWDNYDSKGDFKTISSYLKHWLSQFSDYQIQFVVDCGSKDWEWFLNLVAEWDKKEEVVVNNIDQHKLQPSLNRIHKEMQILLDAKGREIIHFDYAAAVPNTTGRISIINRTGLPKLPSNISPVPFDLNDLIAIKKGISPKEAFDLSREELAFGKVAADSTDDKHNALWDAKVIKAAYNKLKTI